MLVKIFNSYVVIVTIYVNTYVYVNMHIHISKYLMYITINLQTSVMFCVTCL